MGTYNASEYYQILTAGLRPGVLVPFDCYVLLQTNQRTVLFIRRDEVCAQEKLDRLATFEYKQLYILTEDTQAYHDYMEQFLATPEGKKVMETLIEKQKLDGEPMTGVPTDLVPAGSPPAVETKVEAAAVPATETTVEAAPAEEAVEKVAGSAETPVETKVEGGPQEAEAVETVSGGGDVPGEEIVIPPSEEEPEEEEKFSGDPREDVIQLLKDNVETLDEQFKLTGKFEEDEETTIQGITQKIEDDLAKVRGLRDEDADLEKIKAVTDVIEEGLTKIAGIADAKDDDRHLALREYVKDLKKQIRSFGQKVEENPHAAEESEDDKNKEKGSLLRAGASLWKIKHLSKTQDVDLLSDTMQGVIEGIQSITGTPITVKSATAETRAEVASHPDVATFVEGLKNTIVAQNRSITELQDRLSRAGQVFGGVRDNWNELQARTGRGADAKESALIQKIGVDMSELENTYRGAHQTSQILQEGFQKLATTAGISKEELEKGPSGGDDSGAKPAGGANTTEGGDLVESSVVEQLRSENNLLRSQLENTKALLETDQKKITEVEKLNESNSAYAGTLEKEVAELKKTVTAQQDKITDLETKADRWSGAMDDADKTIQTERTTVKGNENTILDLRDRVATLEETVNLYKSKFGDIKTNEAEVMKKIQAGEIPQDVAAVITNKDVALAASDKKAEERNDRIKELQKDIVKLNAKNKDAEQSKLRMAQMFEKFKLARDTARQSEEGLNRKITLLTNLLDESRVSVGKLTGVNEELRQDRMTYINKTNQALRDFKDMVSKANSLNNHVQAEIQRSKAMADQNESFRQRQKELSAQVAELQRKVTSLESENTMMKKRMEGAAVAAEKNQQQTRKKSRAA